MLVLALHVLRLFCLPCGIHVVCMCPAATPEAGADFLGFGSGQEAAEEAFMPESPRADSSQGLAAEPAHSSYPPPPGPQPATPDGLADFFSTPAAPTPSSGAGPQSSTAHIDDMFSAGPRPKAPAPKPQAAPAAASSSSSGNAGSRQAHGSGSCAGIGLGTRPVPKPVPKPAPASMIDFGDEAALLAENPDLYKGLEEVAGERQSCRCASSLVTMARLYLCLHLRLCLICICQVA